MTEGAGAGPGDPAPALGALAAEPKYVLVDTAIVGRIGTLEPAALAIAGTFLATSVTLFDFLTYGTTARVARLRGAGEIAVAGRVGTRALWLAPAFGGLLFALALLLGGPAVSLMGGKGRVGDLGGGSVHRGAPAFGGRGWSHLLVRRRAA